MNRTVRWNSLCTPQLRAKAAAFLEHQVVLLTEDAGSEVRASATDDFNFVSHVTLGFDASGQLNAYRCDCPHHKEFCVHCAAAALSLGLKETASRSRSAIEIVSEAPKKPAEPPVPETPAAPPVKAPAEPPVPETPAAPPAETPVEPPIPETPAAPPAEAPVEPPVPETPAEEPPAEAPAEETPAGHRTMRIRFGDTRIGDEPVYWLPNDTEAVFHTNTGIIGTMGTGKTQFTKSLVTQLMNGQRSNYDGSPLGILIFDYKGDYNETKTDFVQATKARVFKPYRIPYNPLSLSIGKTFKPLLPMHTANAFKDTISKIYNLGPKQQQTLLDCIEQAYKEQGILSETPSTWIRKPPTFEQVYEIFSRDSETRAPDSLSAAMNKLHSFCIFESDPAKSCSLSSLLRGTVVMDLSGYDEDIQSLVVAITLDLFYAQMQTLGSSQTDGRYRQLRTLILVDEADNFMSQEFPALRKIMKEAREFGVGVILSTQSLTHFVGGEEDYSRYILTWVVHNVSDLKQKDVEYVFKLPPKSPEILQQYAAIKALQKHESVVKVSGGEPIAIRDLPFWKLLSEQ